MACSKNKYSNLEQENNFIKTIKHDLVGYEIHNTAEANDYLYDEQGYSTVDFVVVKDKKIKCFIEVRARGELHKLPYMTINVRKLNKINVKYPNTIILWYSTHDHSDFYFAKYTPNFLTDSSLLFAEAPCPNYGIPLFYMKNKLDDLIECITTF